MGLKSVTDYATNICTKYGQKVQRLSGLGMQLSSVPGTKTCYNNNEIFALFNFIICRGHGQTVQVGVSRSNGAA